MARYRLPYSKRWILEKKDGLLSAGEYLSSIVIADRLKRNPVPIALKPANIALARTVMRDLKFK